MKTNCPFLSLLYCNCHFYIAAASKTTRTSTASLTQLFRVLTQNSVAIPSRGRVKALLGLLKIFHSYSEPDTAILRVSTRNSFQAGLGKNFKSNLSIERIAFIEVQPRRT